VKTEDLIEQLATSAGPVRPHAARMRTTAIVGAGAVLAVPIMLLALGLRRDLASAAGGPMFWMKLVYCLMLFGAGAVAVDRLARPGGRCDSRLAAAIGVPVALVLLAALVQIGLEPQDTVALVLGSSWRVCPLYITMVSIPVFIAALYAARTLAPTNLHAAGFSAGLLAGATGAAVYSFHCTESAAPFLAVWYSAGILLPAIIGAALGPRVLRW
jgi:hypothetical protein